jgi:hypothetical protein
MLCNCSTIDQQQRLLLSHISKVSAKVYPTDHSLTSGIFHSFDNLIRAHVSNVNCTKNLRLSSGRPRNVRNELIGDHLSAVKSARWLLLWLNVLLLYRFDELLRKRVQLHPPNPNPTSLFNQMTYESKLLINQTWRKWSRR